MKVFISHSSRDKWIARKISEELQALGATTFLDEKDIKTGESIDEAVGAHLKESDELLMLLSPVALASHWVLIEIGGAKALGKRLVPILLHVPPNDIPAPLTPYLARDLNDIDKYYDEVKARLKGVAPKVAPRKRRVRTPLVRVSFEKGDRIRIARRGDVVDFPGWNYTMETLLGQEATVIGPGAIGPLKQTTVKLDIDGGVYHWLTAWLDRAG